MASKKIFISKEDLNILVWLLPTTKIAEAYSVSDGAIGKLCKKFDIIKPERGYWRKRHCKLIHTDIAQL